MDFLPAYDSYIHLLLPRWGGNPAEMYAFGVESLQTGRYDTWVPFQFLRSLLLISAELDGARSYWSEPAIYRKLQEMFDGYRTAKATPEDRAIMETARTVVAWYAREYLAAKYTLEEMTEKPVPRISVDYFNVPWEWVLGEIRARTGPLAEEVRKAEEAAEARRYAEALEIYEGTKPAAIADDPTAEFVRRRIVDVRLRRQFDEGKWVDLLPDEAMRGWRIISGKWSLETDGWFHAVAGGAGFEAVCLTDFGSRFEVEVEFDPASPAEKATWSAKLAVANEKGLQRYDVWRYYQVDSRHGEPVPFSVKVWDGFGIDTEKNFRPTVWETTLPQYSSASKFVMIASDKAYPQALLNFRNLRIRRLDTKLELPGETVH
jgi:hypothetical protein